MDATEEEEAQDEEEEEEEEPISPVDSMSTITSAPSAKKPEYEFLLFNYLLRYVHREGRIGDFARAGILFLVDVAMGAPSGDFRQLEDNYDSSKGGPSSAPDPIADASLALAEYIHDGDFAEVLGAGLVAVYSLLPSKLEIRRDIATPETGGAMTLGRNVSDQAESQGDMDLEKARTFGLEVSSDPEFQSRLDHFLKMIEFLQDVLRRNIVPTEDGSSSASAVVGQAISTSILQAVKTIFLENVLYPSVLESSDVDGSVVAVLSYIDATLRTLPDGPLAELFIDFLMSEDDVELSRPTLSARRGSRATREAKLRRRKSSAMMLLELETPVERRHSTYFASLGRFTLKDLVFSNLRNMSDRTHDAASTAVLQLLQTLLTYHPRLTVDKLLVHSGPAEPSLTIVAEPLAPGSPESDEEFVYPDGQDKEDDTFEPEDLSFQPLFRLPDTTLTTHERELGLYLNLVSRVDPTYDGDVFSTGYDNYLGDALETIKVQLDRVARGQTAADILKYRLNPNDTLLSLLLQSLRTFFTHSVEYNVSLTGALSAIASSPSRSLVGWMTFDHPSSHTQSEINEVEPLSQAAADDEGEDTDDRSLDDRILLSTSGEAGISGGPGSHPILHVILRGLVLQLDRYRTMIENFDGFLSERRQGLVFAENLTDALNLSIELDQDNSFFGTLKSTLTPSSSKQAIVREGTATPPRKPIATAASFVSSFLTPRKDKSSQTSSNAPTSSSPSFETMPTTPKKDKSGVKVAASPFGPHYEKTGKISVQPLVAPLDESENAVAAWMPPKFGLAGDLEEMPEEDEDEDDPFSPRWESSPAVNSREPIVIKAKITLSQLLDNVVILEEFMKELSAIVQVRRSLGIDAVRYF